MQDETETLLGVADAAKALGVTPMRVRQLADEGKLRHQRTLSGTRLFKASDVDAHREARQKKASPARGRK